MKIFGLLSFLFLAALATGCSGSPSRGRGPDSKASNDLDPAFASRAVQLSLHCVEQEEPHHNEGQGKEPHAIRIRHPAFFGCYDWHSAVHGHWAMLRAVDQVKNLPEKGAIVATLGNHLTAENIRAELEFLKRNPTFEEPYGWGWYLRLAEELRVSELPEAKAWQAASAPLENKIVRLMLAYLRKTKTPNRAGMHGNTAYAMIHALDYAKTTGRHGLRHSVEAAARKYFNSDRNCPLETEPGPHDFISPCFVEADLMRRVLPREEFAAWLDRFLPSLKAEELRPVPPKNINDGHEVHLVGLMFQKAGAMTAVANLLEEHDVRRAVMASAIAEQSAMGEKLMFQSDYGGTHWLASFAIYYYSGVGQ